MSIKLAVPFGLRDVWVLVHHMLGDGTVLIEVERVSTSFTGSITDPVVALSSVWVLGCLCGC